jgi:hypothetical protein
MDALPINSHILYDANTSRPMPPKPLDSNELGPRFDVLCILTKSNRTSPN